MKIWNTLVLCVLCSGAISIAAAQQATTTQASATPSAPAASPKPDAKKIAAASSSGAAPYTVKDGNKVDKATLMGWRTWRALACERCHGAEQEGLVGPPLVESMKKLSKEDFHSTVINGRPEKGMPPFGASKMVTENWEGLYAYLKGRSDGKIKPGHVYALDAKQQ